MQTGHKHRGTDYHWDSLNSIGKQLFSHCWYLLTSFIAVSPTGHPAVSAIVEHAATGCQTHRSDVVGEINRCSELEQSDVIVTGVTVVVWM